MKTLLRNISTGFYFQGRDNWTAFADKALDFKSTERVIRFVRDTAVDTMELELLLCFDDTRYNISLPLDERFGIYADVPATGASRIQNEPN